METEERGVLENVLARIRKIDFDKWAYSSDNETGMGKEYQGTDVFETAVEFYGDTYEIKLKGRDFFSPATGWDDYDRKWTECFFSVYSAKDCEKVFDVSHSVYDDVDTAFYALRWEREARQKKADEVYKKKREVEEAKLQEEKRKERMEFLGKHIPRLEKALEGI